MGVLVGETPTGNEIARRNQGLDHSVIGRTLLALLGDDGKALEARCVLGIESVRAHRGGNVNVDALGHQLALMLDPRGIVIGTVAWRGVDEARSGVVGDVVAIKQRHSEGVTKGRKRM